MLKKLKIIIGFQPTGTNSNTIIIIIGPVPTKDMHTPPHPSEVAILICKMRKMLNKDVLNNAYYIISHLGAMGVQKGLLGAQKFYFLQKWPIFEERRPLPKVRIAHKNSFMQKISIRSIPIFPANLATFEEN